MHRRGVEWRAVAGEERLQFRGAEALEAEAVAFVHAHREALRRLLQACPTIIM
jgi:hypothetical protein